mmetsp:Transcript_2304/g.5314  ORF Transcript_2304/g.5314 Transcript_2304/m.5314 type:complete len:84 (-) Transcript_2304:23-274(-)
MKLEFACTRRSLAGSARLLVSPRSRWRGPDVMKSLNGQPELEGHSLLLRVGRFQIDLEEDLDLRVSKSARDDSGLRVRTKERT